MVTATARSIGHGRNVANPAWLEKQPSVQPPAGAGSGPPGAAGAAGTVGGAAPLTAAVPALSPVPLVSTVPLVSSAPDGASRVPIAAHLPSAVKNTGSPQSLLTVHSPSPPAGTCRHTFASTVASVYSVSTAIRSSGTLAAHQSL